jgi:hypothetical protein
LGSIAAGGHRASAPHDETSGLQPWLRVALQHLRNDGLQRAELKLADFSDQKPVSQQSRHTVLSARAPDGRAVALKRYAVTESQLRSLRKVCILAVL